MKTMKTYFLFFCFVIIIIGGCKRRANPIESETDPPINTQDPGGNTSAFSITSPINGASVSGTVTIAVSSGNVSGIIMVYFYVDGSIVGIDYSAPYSYPFEANDYSNGTHILSVKGYDGSGGVIATDSKTVTISGSNSDNIDPVISITAPLNNATVTGDVSIMVSASDNIGIEKVEFYINNVNEGIDYYSPYMYQWDATGKSNGIYYLKAIAYDAAGNTASAIISVIVTNQYVFTFTNQVHTPVDVTVNGSTKTMAAGSSVSFTFTTNPGSFTYAAQTSGKTNTGQIIGEVLYWGGEITTSNYSSVRLYYSSNYFFLRINNTAGSTSFNGPLVVNAGLQAEKTENIALPTGSTYNIGYFPAFSNTTIQLYSNPGAWYVYWTQGINFTFPGTDDQQITLSNTSLQMMKANGGTQSAADASMKYLMPRESIHSPIISQEAEAPKEHEVPVQYELRHKARHNYHP